MASLEPVDLIWYVSADYEWIREVARKYDEPPASVCLSCKVVAPYRHEAWEKADIAAPLSFRIFARTYHRMELRVRAEIE